MKKYENVDIISILSEIMEHNTQYYQSDFEYDKKTIERCAKSESKDEKTLLWMSRKSGTWCFNERNTYLKDTFENNAWQNYGEGTGDKVKACAVEITNTENGCIFGNVYELNYLKHIAEVKSQTFAIENVIVTFEDGSKQEGEYKEYKKALYDKEVILIEFETKQDDYLRTILINSHQKRVKRCVPYFK